MPWYQLSAITSGSIALRSFRNIGLMSTPFIYNGVKYDFETTPINYLNGFYAEKINSTACNGVSLYLGTQQTDFKFIFYIYSSYPNFSLRAPAGVYYSKADISITGFSKLTEKTINGKFKLKSITTPSYGGFAFGGVIPLKFSINNLNYKYLYWSALPAFNSGTYNYNAQHTIYLGGFNELPIVSNDILIAPSDFKSYSTESGQNIIIDFGNNNQEIPSSLYYWITQNFDRAYENTYTIKSATGPTLATLTEAPPMTSATLSAVGNAKYLTLKGENDTNYTMEWTSETPQGKIFAGLATSKGGSIVIPVGETSTINLTESTDLYEVWQTYRPPTTTFEIKTYNYSGETSRVDKTDYLTPISTISGVLRGEASLLNFNVLIQSDTVPNFNYCYIDKFKRYYYVTEPVSVRQNLWEMTMQVDALMTYKDSLLKCEGYIDRNEYIQNKMIIDNNRAIMQGADFEEDTITNAVFGEGSFVLSGLGLTLSDT